MAQLIPFPLTVSCFSKIQVSFTFLVPAHPGSPGKRAVKRVCVCFSIAQVRDQQTHTQDVGTSRLRLMLYIVMWRSNTGDDDIIIIHH